MKPQISLLSPELQTLASGHSSSSLSAMKMKQIEEKSVDFEAVFISEMMKPMFEGLETDGLFGGGQAEEMFRSIMLQEVGKIAAQTGQIGIAPDVKAELIRMQAEQSNAKQNTPAPKATDLEIVYEG